MKVLLTAVFIVAFACSHLRAKDVFSFERPSNEMHVEALEGLCPNNKTKCSPSQTCCKTKHNSYHCCKYKNAVCCSDRYHCCPEDSTCDIEKKRCNRNIATDPMEWKIEESDPANEQEMMKLSKSENLLATPKEFWSLDHGDKTPLTSEAMCPNNKTKCKDTKTCCITKHGNYYCCPHKNAVCCSDKWSCCPEGTTCDVKNKKCPSSTNIIKTNSILLKSAEESTTVQFSSLIDRFIGLFNGLGRRCGNTQKDCPGEEKCCPMQSEKFGCCKYRKGVCCPDFATCCPHGTQCDIKAKSCTAKPDDLIPVTITETPDAGMCPDNRTQCNAGETCCSVGNILYGCCPMKDATCCSDKLTCCPHNKKCDLLHRRCITEDVGIEKPVDIKKSESLKQKSLKIFLSNIGLSTVCPDKSSCQGLETCCQMSGGHFGCCPYQDGTCCPNLTTCCPSGTTCSGNNCV